MDGSLYYFPTLVQLNNLLRKYNLLLKVLYGNIHAVEYMFSALLSIKVKCMYVFIYVCMCVGVWVGE